MLAVRVPRARAEETRLWLAAVGLLDRGATIQANGPFVDLPVLAPPTERAEFELIASPDLATRPRPPTPLDAIRARLDLPPALATRLPRRWEMLGDVLLLRLSPELESHGAAVAEAYAAALGARTVLRDLGGIAGPFREPRVAHLWGEGTETTHWENGVAYRLDAAKLMFSSGNLPERMRMASAVQPDETVVDLFAGIGYFTLPMAVHGAPAQIVACEANPIAFRYLEENVRINRVGAVVEPRLGDCREVAPAGSADRVVMGYLDTAAFLPTALRALRPEGGTLHYHEACPVRFLPERPVRAVEEAANAAGRRVEATTLHRVKSYAPSVAHVVLDARIR